VGLVGNIGQGRLLRVCDLCGGVDDHPRHVLAGGPGSGAVFAQPGEDILAAVLAAAPDADRARLVRDLMDTTSSDRHLDCCREAGCPDGSCDVQTAGAESKRGKALLAHLMANVEATS
jgi:hypothetical protein